MRQNVELLAPAGDIKCFNAAIAAGADAVYLGLKRFGARAFAGNLSCEELKEALEKAHILGKKIYLTVNTLFKDDEMAELADLLSGPYEDGLDGVIVQDIGVMSYISRTFCDLPVHVSTQAAVTSTADVMQLLPYGISRVVPARELSLDEIRSIKEETGIEIECFIHGSMCYSYSGKCLLSSFIGGRSGNRGRCAQPCRLLYDGQYLLSLKDMCMLGKIPDLIGAGIDSFKIEGRMKSSAYVYGVTSVYRKYIDLALSEKEYTVDPSDIKRVLLLYTRGGNCDGYYFRHNGRDMITAQNPSYESKEDPAAFNDNDLTLPKRPVKIKCSINAGENAEITVFDEKTKVSIKTDVIPDEATGRPVSNEDIAASLKKLGGTLFEASDIGIDSKGGVFLAKSAVNRIRRDGIEAFKEAVLSEYRRNPSGILTYDQDDISERKVPDETAIPDVRVSVLDLKQLKSALYSKADALIIPMNLFEEAESFLDLGLNGKDIYISLPYVIRKYKNASSEAIIDFVKKYGNYNEIKGFYVSNPGSVRILSGLNYNGRIICDIHMYAYNREAVRDCLEMGTDTTTVPVELNEKELSRRNVSGEELIIYGRIPVMISANCVYNTKKGCGSSSGGHMLYITDRKNEKLPVHCICSECVNVIYNSHILDIADEEQLIRRIRPSSVGLCFTDEDEKTVAAVIDTYVNGRNAVGACNFKLSGKYTRGHLKRGVD